MRHRISLASFFSVLVLAVASGMAQSPQSITLKEAQDIALSRQPQLRAAQLTAQASQQVVTEARSAYFPFASGNMTGAGALDKSRFAAGGLNNPIIYDREADGFTAGQLITDFGRTANLVASARLQAQASNENVNTTRADVLLRVDRAYFGLLRSMAILKVAQETVSERQLVVDQVTALAKSKLKSDLDVSFASVNLAEAKITLLQAQNDVKSSNAEMSAALGYSDEHTFVPADESLPPEALPELTQAVAEALRNRPELASLRFRRDSDERFAKAERDLWFPSISMLGGAGLIPAHDNNLLGRFAAVGLNINIPVFNGHLFAARRAEAMLKFHAAEQNVQGLENEIARDVRFAWLNTDTAFQRLGLTKQLLDQASFALDLAQATYKLGLGSIVELSQAELNKTQAEIEQSSAKYEYQIQRTVLSYQLGALH